MDRRRTAARADLAASELRGKVVADAFVDGHDMRVVAPVAPLHRTPQGDTGLDTQLLMGEPFRVYETVDGWAWGQSGLDGYVGYVPAADLAPATLTPSHRVTTAFAHAYAQPSIKTVPLYAVPRGAQLTLTKAEGGFLRTPNAEYVPSAQVGPITDLASDWVGLAETYCGVPYLWGGRSTRGLDCSALVQLARQAAGFACPRDSDMQEAELGWTIPQGTALRRGDLVFWAGHVGILLDHETLLHANAHHMQVAIEGIDGAMERIEGAGGGRVTRVARMEG